ncbi:POTRA domain-containing protein [uncultured Porphyromonas sp.]|uniref:BamA/OMP85 family outer membrane protein n=1 Tax=uncultured Porphyromonas sp. TaxID=159274 RepID=UPI002635A8D1|nr:POTRA domain-containing protein [uncultured Porphyromonas sp.]
MMIMQRYYNILFALIALLTVTSVSAQVATTPADTVYAPAIDYARPVTKTIAGVTITGTQGYDQEVLLGYTGLKVGERIEIPGAATTAVVQQFTRNGTFANARVLVTKYVGDKVWLEVQLEQHPRIASVTFHNIKKSEREDLETKTGLRESMQLSPNVLDRTEQLIQKYYNEKGYSDMEVTFDQQPDLSREGYVKLGITVDKKYKTKIANIYFSGNKALSDTDLRKAMKKTNETFRLNRGNLWNSFLELFQSKKFIQDVYREDLHNILEAYHKAGYRDAEILSDSIARNPKNDKQIDIFITLSEGHRYYIKDINFVGNTKFPTPLLEAMLGMQHGDVYDQDRLTKRLYVEDDAVANLYYNNGYIFSGIDPVETYVEGDSVSLDLRIVEGPQATIDKVIIRGNHDIYEEVVRRELFTKPGKLFSKEDMMNSWMTLNQLGHFDPEKSFPTPIPNPQEGTVDIEYSLQRRNNDKFELSFGWSQAGVIGRAGINFTNFSIYNLFHPKAYRGLIPQGDGQTLSLNAMSNGRYYHSFSLQFSDPWFGGKRPNFFTASLFYSMQTAIDTRYYNNRTQGMGYYPGYYGGYGGYGGYGYGGYGGYGYDGGYRQSLMENSYNPNQSMHIFGATVGFGKRLNWPDNWFNVNATLNYTHYYLRDWVYETFQGFHNGHANDISLTLALSRNSIDNPIYTRRGSSFTLSVSATPPYSLWDGIDYSNINLKSEDRYRFVEYHKWKFSGKVFTPLMNPVTVKYTPVLMTRLDAGFIGHYTPFKRSPFGTYYMGGDNMSGYVGNFLNETIPLRGYSNGSIAGGNYDYAYAYMRMMAELRVPILFEGQYNVWAVAFLEAGNAWRDISSFNAFNLKRSAGVGFRITLPFLGMLGLDWGYGFDKPDGSSQRGGSNIHIVMGQEF